MAMNMNREIFTALFLSFQRSIISALCQSLYVIMCFKWYRHSTFILIISNIKVNWDGRPQTNIIERRKNVLFLISFKYLRKKCWWCEVKKAFFFWLFQRASFTFVYIIKPSLNGHINKLWWITIITNSQSKLKNK